MNIRETVTIRSPNGIDEECAKFTIDEVAKPYVFRKTTKSNEKYTYSAWVMSEIKSTLSIQGKEIPVTTNWKRQKIVFTANGSSLKIHFNKAGIYYIYKSQLETGDVATDWAPSPEDIEESLKATNARFELVVNKETLKTEINALADTFTFTGNGFVVNAKNLTIAEDGTIKALNGEFTGKITANTGEIGKWTIGNGRIYSQGSDGKYTKVQSTNGWKHAFIVGAPNKDNSVGAPFYVTHEGKLHAEKAEIEGKIEASSGTIGGWTIGEYALTSGKIDSDTYTSLSGDGIEWIIGVSENFYNSFADRIENLPYQNRKFQFYSADKQYDSDKATVTPLGGFDAVGMFRGTSNINLEPGVDNYTEYIVRWNGNANLKTVKINDLISDTSIYIKCNGTTENDNNKYAIRFFKGENNTAWFRPCASGKTNLGGPNYPWSNVYATNGTIQTSDRNKKKNIQYVEEKYIELFDLLIPKTFKMKDGKRTHIGFIAQEVEEAMKTVGLSNEEFAGLCIDRDEEENTHYSLRYDELFMLCVAKLKQLEREISYGN